MNFIGGRHPERGNLFPSRMGITSDGQVNSMDFLFKRSFEALAEISDFVAGLVHSSKEAEWNKGWFVELDCLSGWLVGKVFAR